MDWTASGIVSEIEYEMVDPRDLDSAKGRLSGVLSGSLTFGFYTDTKAIGTLTVSDCDYEPGNLVRIYYTASLDGEYERVCLGTFFAGTSSAHYERGTWSGKIDLSSILTRYTDDLCETDTVLAKGRSAKGWFWSACRWTGSTGAILGDIADKAFPKAAVIEYGSAKLDVLNKIADILGGTIGVDPYGRVTLRKYLRPSDKPVSFRVESGDRSVTFSGVDYEDGKSDVVNRCCVKYAKEDGTAVYGLADLPSTSDYSFQRTGRRITRCYELDTMSPETADEASARAERHLASFGDGTASWSFSSFFLPYSAGDVIRFDYKDSDDDEGISVDGLVTELDISWDSAAVRMDTTIKEVRRYA